MNNEKLIELVKGYTFLYDPSDKKYWDNSHKDAAWREISRKLKVEDRDCRRCWALLRDGFRRAVKRETQAESGQRKPPFRKWRYLESMSFLSAYKIDKQNSSNDSNQPEHNDQSIESEDYKCSVEYPCNELSSDNISTVTNPATELVSNNRKRKIVRQRTTRRGNASSSLIKYLLNRKKEMDDTEQFFTSIATTVRSFPLRERAIAKAKVFQVISAMEIELLSDPHASACFTPDQKPFCEFDPSNEISSE